MKFSTLQSLSLATVLMQSRLLPVTSAASATSLRGNRPAAAASNHRVLEEDETGVFLVAEFEYEERGNRPDKTLNIETQNGIFEIKNSGQGWADELTSGASVIKIPKGAIQSGAIIDMKGAKPSVVGGPNIFGGRKLLEEDDGAARSPEQQRNLDELRRQLAIVEGQKSVLAVRVIHDGTTDRTALTALEPSYTKAQLADDVFGAAISETDPDPVNLHSQFLACSHGKLDFQPTSDLASGIAEVTNIANGVVDVTVSTVCSTTCDGQMRNDVNNALSAAFGTSANLIADHVMHCLPNGAMSGIAYAYINSWNSVYSNNWCRYTSAQLHEIGHNLNLAHAGENGNQYDDRSGFMGYSYSQDDQRMCFNNAKNWQLGWFSDEVVQIGLNEEFSGTLKGQVNYGNGDSDSKVVVKVADPNSANAFYIGFNHRVKANSQSNEAGNLITIQEYTGNGYSQSNLIGKIGANTSWSRVLGPDTVQVDVGAIDSASENFGTAAITISYGGSAAPTNSPTPLPTKAPTPPTPPPTNAPTSPPTTGSPTKNPTPAPTGSPVVCPLAKFGEACNKGPDCCSGSCTSGKPSTRTCLQ
mmetsp:Transcript_35943/g.75671  ORF Transcript_35943/g.75671 Transcript_35943/m.75671 type:complete len:585 (+) Transcript_35943:327-2081(+)